ncbi:hypothetical protein [Kluyvera intermedia]|uniref:hypothetical protein n=1 Tax=Kluyvera intermedia TaxID=61648 RepID=UPI00352464F2
MLGIFPGNRRLEDPSDRLLRLLNEHGDRVIIDKDGIVSTNFDNPEIKAELARQFEALSKVEVCKS